MFEFLVEMAESSEVKEEVDENISERAKIEGYLKQYCLEECLDEAINEVVDKRPSNPYMLISRFMETKTFPEILDLQLSVSIIGRGLTGVQATLTTNLAEFVAVYPLGPYNPLGAFSDADMLVDFAVLQSKAKEALKGQDPTKTEEIDETISNIPNITHAVAMTVSMACCRAGARHSGNKPLYKFMAEQIGTTPKMPVPVATVLTRAVGQSVVNTTQAFTVIPTSPSFFDGAMESVMHAAQAVNKALSTARPGCTVSDLGCPTVLPTALTAEACMSLVNKCLKEEGIEGAPKVGLDCRAAELLEGGPSPEGDDIPYEDTEDKPTSYIMEPAQEAGEGGGEDVPEKSMSGEEMVEHFLGFWKATEYITLEDPVALRDDPSVDLLQASVEETVAGIKSTMDSTTLKYNLAGVGGDAKCPLQIVADKSVSKLEDVATVRHPFNTIKVDLSKAGVGGVTNVLQMCTAIRDANKALVVGCLEGMPEVCDSFIADFAVAVGADQYYGGGMQATEYGCKYTRLVEIARADDELKYPGKAFRT